MISTFDIGELLRSRDFLARVCIALFYNTDIGESLRSRGFLARVCVVLLNGYWGIVSVPGVPRAKGSEPRGRTHD